MKKMFENFLVVCLALLIPLSLWVVLGSELSTGDKFATLLQLYWMFMAVVFFWFLFFTED